MLWRVRRRPRGHAGVNRSRLGAGTRATSLGAEHHAAHSSLAYTPAPGQSASTQLESKWSLEHAPAVAAVLVRQMIKLWQLQFRARISLILSIYTDFKRPVTGRDY